MLEKDEQLSSKNEESSLEDEESSLEEKHLLEAIEEPPSLTLLSDEPEHYFNRELSWLEFNRRVFEESQDRQHPLLERVKFVAIFGSNLDEFFMTRVAGIKQQIQAGVTKRTHDGMTSIEELSAIRKQLRPMLKEIRNYLIDTLLPELQEAGIYILKFDELTKEQQQEANKFFEKEIFAVLTPLAFDVGRPFPYISNLSLNLAVRARTPKDDECFARVKVPAFLPRLVPVKPIEKKKGQREFYFVWLEDLIIANISSLFRGVEVLEAHPFRVTRSADMEIQVDEASDLLHTIEAGLRKRKFGPVVRLTIVKDMPSHIREWLVENLQIRSRDIYKAAGILGLNNLMSLLSIKRPDLKDAPFVPKTPPIFHKLRQEFNVFDAIRQHDILLHHPFDSFVPVIDFLKAAARDPQVLAIKQTLYRVGKDSPIIQALMEAREKDKEVAVLVELKARFDEESNIGWARRLEQVGVHVVYGFEGLKVHSKITLVVRKENDGLRRYLHLGTGNYNDITAKLYTDLGLLTCSEDFGADASELFNHITGWARQINYKKLLIAPSQLRPRIIEMIAREASLHSPDNPGHLIFKMNALVDAHMIRALYKASQAGVKIELIIRGICCLRPGIEGISENIRVISIVGRFLEHTRIFYFGNGGDEEIYLGSADLMPRNLNWRVETNFPIEDPDIRNIIKENILQVYFKDTAKSHLLLTDGTYQRLVSPPGEEPFNSQLFLLP